MSGPRTDGGAGSILGRAVCVLAGLALVGLALVGCVSPDAPPSTRTTTQETRTPMSDATTLKENLPTTVDGVRLIAFNIETGTAGLHIGSDKRTVALDESVTIGGKSYTVSELVPTSKARGDHANGWVSLTAE